MKKILPVFLALIIFFTSTIMQVNKVQAIGFAPVLAGAGAVAAGPYVIAGLLVAGGAAVVVGASDEDIRNKAIEIYNQTSDGFKTTLEQAIAAGNTTITLTSDMKNEITTAAGDIGVYLGTLLGKYEANVSADGTLRTDPTNQLTLAINTNVAATYNFAFARSLNVASAENLKTTFYNGNMYVQTTAWTGSAWLTHSFWYGPTTSGFGLTLKGLYDIAYANPTVENLKKFYQTAGADTGLILKASAVASNDVFDGNFESALQGLNEFDIPLDEWLAQAQTATGQKVNVDTSTGAMTLEDGTPYDGDLRLPWSIPKGKAGTFPEATLDNPAVPTDEVFPKNPTAEEPATGTGDGVLQGLWDWLKGILQKILDALLALGSLIGVVGLVQSILNLIETLSNSIEGWKNAPTKKIDWSKLTVAAGTLTTVFPFSIPWDVFRLFNVMNVQPITPVFEISTNKIITIFDTNIPIKYDFDIDFEFFNPIASIGRWALILIFDISIIMALRRLTPD